MHGEVVRTMEIEVLLAELGDFDETFFACSHCTPVLSEPGYIIGMFDSPEFGVDAFLMSWMLVHVIKNCTYVFIREKVSILTDKIFVNRTVIFFLTSETLR